MEIGPDDDRTATEVSVSAANTVNTIDPDRPMDLRRVIAMAGARRNATAAVIAHVEVSRGTRGTVEGAPPGNWPRPRALCGRTAGAANAVTADLSIPPSKVIGLLLSARDAKGRDQSSVGSVTLPR